MKLTAETLIKSDRETVWRLSQTPLLHARWDLRFTDIEYLPRESSAEPQRFRYATRIGFAVKGWGETIGDPERSTSALRFGSTDAKSIIREGTGSWTYSEQAGTVRFSTVYDYTIRHGWFGRVLDLLFRPLMIWATRWSFDRVDRKSTRLNSSHVAISYADFCLTKKRNNSLKTKRSLLPMKHY